MLPVMSPVDSSCSQLTVYGAVGQAPGLFTSFSVTIVQLASPTSLDTGTWNRQDACVMVGSDVSPQGTCSGTVNLNFAAGDEIAVCLTDFASTPAHTQFAWNIVCSAP
jgi:hypothetical protein